MEQSGETFAPRSSLVEVGKHTLEFYNRYQTPVSIAVAALGALALLAGPVRSALSSSSSANTGNDGAITAWQAQQGFTTPEAGSSRLVEQVTRQLQAFTTVPDRPRDEVVTYTVKRGDTLFGISEVFSLDINTLFWSNKDTLQDNVHNLQPGLDLFILPVDGAYYRSDGELSLQWVADHYLVDVNTILSSEFNRLDEYTPTDVPHWGMQIVVPGGTDEFVNIQPVAATTDPTTGTVSYAFFPGHPGSCAAGIAGGGGTGAWVPPLAPSSFTFTQSFYPGHSGVDLAAPVGTPVYAADTGVVIFSGWNNNGYGILVVLDHGNGWTTYYAHLNTRSVVCGQAVQRGGYIGQVGTTGNSTGPHLHFEMRWSHNPDNPAYYIGF